LNSHSLANKLCDKIFLYLSDPPSVIDQPAPSPPRLPGECSTAGEWAKALQTIELGPQDMPVSLQKESRLLLQRVRGSQDPPQPPPPSAVANSTVPSLVTSVWEKFKI
jgi:hypothetical protein